MPSLQPFRLLVKLDDFNELIQQSAYLFADIYSLLDEVKALDGKVFKPGSVEWDHDHTALLEGGDYPWADFVAADVTYLQSLLADITQTDLVDKSADETITGTWTFNSLLFNIPTVTYTADQVLDDDDWGKIIKVNSAGLVNITLQAASAANVNKWEHIIRIGAGELRIHAAGTDTIGPSSAGGYIRSAEVRDNPRISLDVPLAGKWSFGFPGSYGIWGVY